MFYELSIQNYDAGHRDRPVIGDVIPGQIYKAFKNILKAKGEENVEFTLNEITGKILPGMCHWSHPHNIAWFPCIHPRVTVRVFATAVKIIQEIQKLK